MSYLNEFLARIFDNFKAANPKLAAVIILLLGSVIFWAENGLGDLIGFDMAKIVEYVAIALGFLTGSRTSKVLAEANKE
jgi:hypothetical protein